MTFNNYLQKDIHIVAILVISTRMEQREMTVTMCFSYREVYLGTKTLPTLHSVIFQAWLP